MAENLYKEWFVRFRFPNYKKTDFHVGKLEELVCFVRGKNITSSEMVFGEYPVISAGIEPSGFHNKFNVKAPSITISSSGANAGYLSFNRKNIWAADCIYANETENIFFVYYSLKFLKSVIKNLQRGSAQPHVYSKDINKIKLNIPTENIILSFNKYIQPISEEIFALTEKNENLIKQRDLLLPRLMSGKLEV